MSYRRDNVLRVTKTVLVAIGPLARFTRQAKRSGHSLSSAIEVLIEHINENPDTLKKILKKQ